MKRPPGRPPLAPGEARTETLRFRARPCDAELLREAGKLEGEGYSELVRVASIVEACGLLGLDAEAFLRDGKRVKAR